MELTYETIHALLEKHKNITALKQACSNLDMVRRLKQQHPDFLIYSGEDGFFDEGFDAGMDGLVSVMGHVCMKELRTFCDDERVDNRCAGGSMSWQLDIYGSIPGTGEIHAASAG